jgi:hypothetical protein
MACSPLYGHGDKITVTQSRQGTTLRAELTFDGGAYAGRIVIGDVANTSAWLHHLYKETAYHRFHGYTISYVWIPSCT